MFLIPKAASAGTEAAECCPVNCNSYNFKQTHFSYYTCDVSPEYFLQLLHSFPKCFSRFSSKYSKSHEDLLASRKKLLI